jgi:iron complex outermembrane receptor protein
MANVESVEVLKGPAAILYGALEPGGIVNINTKQPLDKPAFSLQQQVGSYASYRTVLDATGPLPHNKDLLYRVIMSYENDGAFRPLDYARNFMINPVVRWNIDASTWIRVSTQYQRNNLNQDQYAIPYFGMYPPLWLGRSFNWGAKSPYNQQENFTEVTWRHDFNKDWSIQQTAFAQVLQNNLGNNGGFSTISDCATPGSTSCFLPFPPFYPPPLDSVVLYNFSSPFNSRQAEYATTVNLVGHFGAGLLNHTLLSGGDYYRYNFRGSYLTVANPETIGLFGAPVSYAPGYAAYPSFATVQYADNVGVYLQDQISLPYGFNVLGGARWQYINSRTGAANNDICGPNNGNLNYPCNYDAITKRGQFVDQRVTPRFGLLWRPLEWISFYGNYAQSYSPNYNGQLVLGSDQPTPPSAGEQEEGGVKLSLFDNRLQATVAYYHLVKTNIPIGVPNDFTHVILVGQGRSQGPELDIQGEPLPGWSVNLAYANTDAITTKSNSTNIGAPVVGQPIPFVPRNVGSLSSAYEFRDGQMKGVRVGARYDYTGYLPFYHTANDGSYIYGQSTSSYGIVGLFGAYEFNVDQFKIIAQLNVSNLLDKTYFVTGGLGPAAFDAAHPGGYAAPATNPVQVGWNLPPFNFNVIGAPRTFRGSIKVSF